MTISEETAKHMAEKMSYKADSKPRSIEGGDEGVAAAIGLNLKLSIDHFDRLRSDPETTEGGDEAAEDD